MLAAWLLVRLQEMDETVVSAYLDRTYTMEVPESLLGDPQEYLPEQRFAGWWVGCYGIVAGTGCGSNPAEAIHSAWQSKLDSVGGRAPLAEVLGVMQNLYADHWASSFEWESEASLSLEAVDIDPTHLQGVQTLNAVHRSPATELFRSHTELSPSYFIYDIDATCPLLQFACLAMPQSFPKTLPRMACSFLSVHPPKCRSFWRMLMFFAPRNQVWHFSMVHARSSLTTLHYVTVQRTKADFAHAWLTLSGVAASTYCFVVP